MDGSFKTPILRNVGLNPTLLPQRRPGDALRRGPLYNRGGDRRGPLSADTTASTRRRPSASSTRPTSTPRYRRREQHVGQQRARSNRRRSQRCRETSCSRCPTAASPAMRMCSITGSADLDGFTSSGRRSRPSAQSISGSGCPQLARTVSRPCLPKHGDLFGQQEPSTSSCAKRETIEAQHWGSAACGHLVALSRIWNAPQGPERRHRASILADVDVAGFLKAPPAGKPRRHRHREEAARRGQCAFRPAGLAGLLSAATGGSPLEDPDELWRCRFHIDPCDPGIDGDMGQHKRHHIGREAEHL